MAWARSGSGFLLSCFFLAFYDFFKSEQQRVFFGVFDIAFGNGQIRTDLACNKLSGFYDLSAIRLAGLGF